MMVMLYGENLFFIDFSRNLNEFSVENIFFILFFNSKGYDWGIYSIDTVMDRQELRCNTLLALANFGDHALHHLFPTLDHGILPELYDLLYETLEEFEAECQCYPWFFETIKGQFQQLSRVEPMKLDSHEKYLLKMGKQSKLFK